MKIVVLTLFQVNPDYQAHMKRDLLALIPHASNERGCIDYVVHQGLTNPNEFTIYHSWVDKDALAAHGQKPYVKDFLSKVQQYQAKPIESKFSRVIEV